MGQLTEQQVKEYYHTLENHLGLPKDSIKIEPLNNCLTKEELTRYLNKRITNAKKHVDSIRKSQGENPSYHCTYFGGEESGYWKGRLSALEDMLDEIESM